MPKKGVRASVKGIPEVNAGLRKVAETDWDVAANKAALGLLPTVKSNTRTDSGRLQSGWEVEGVAFINDVFYSTFQEYGTRYIEPMDAIGRAVDQNEDKLIKAFDDEAKRAITEAGFSS